MYSDPNRCFRRRLCREKGYTLIEVLVAMVIFTSMLLLAGMALNQGLAQYRGLVEKGLNFWTYAKDIWVDKSLNSTVDYYVYTRTDGWFPFFKGSQEGISYVSLTPFTGDLPIVAWMKVEAEDGGKRRLMYYELPVYTKTYEEIESHSVFGDYKKGESFKVLEGVEDIAFSFYGYDVFEKRYKWHESFNGNRMKRLPTLVRISYRQDGKPGGLVLGINVNSLMKTNYNERYPR
jgi:general secretion pathway protein J